MTFRQASDSAILVEFGEMTLDLTVRARIHAFETEIKARGIPGIWALAPCIRSTMVSSTCIALFPTRAPLTSVFDRYTLTPAP